jgi:hypothetical protein
MRKHDALGPGVRRDDESGVFRVFRFVTLYALYSPVSSPRRTPGSSAFCF